ncbi:MAG: ParA family protein [Acidisphaera sp.]|nr:ParA family protein [Acidisphaera sp.]
MKVIGLLSRKGGSGKTTLTVHLGVLAQAVGLRTLLIDLDPQHSAADWWRAREAETPQLVQTAPAELRDVLDVALTDGVDVVVIDTRPSAAQDAALVAALSDLILVPTRPSILDLRAILDTIDIAQGAARRSLIVLNACPPPRGAGEASLTGDARRAVAAFGVPVAPVPIVNRTMFASALLTGLTAGEADPGGKADREMRALWRVVEKELNHGKGYIAERAGDEKTARARAAGAGH